MEAHVRAPNDLSDIGDMALNWSMWREDFEIFIKLTGYDEKPDEIQSNLLKNLIGAVGNNAIRTISFDEPKDKDKLDILLAKLEQYFNPPKSEVLERFNFFNRQRKPKESLQDYITALTVKAKTCHFGRLESSLIRDRVVYHFKDKVLQEKLFATHDLDIQKLISVYTAHQKSMKKTQETISNVIKTANVDNESVQSQEDEDNEYKRVCWRCKYSHPIRACPAWGSKCGKCGELHHYTQNCRNVEKQGEQNPVSTNNEYKRICWRCKCSHPVRACPAWGSKCGKCGELHHYTQNCRNVEKQSKQNPVSTNNEKKEVCWRCNFSHPMKNCSAWLSKCGKCGELHHYTQCCRNKISVDQNTLNLDKNKFEPNADKNVFNPTCTKITNLSCNNFSHMKSEIQDQSSKTLPSAPPLPQCTNVKRLYPAVIPLDSTNDKPRPSSGTKPLTKGKSPQSDQTWLPPATSQTVYNNTTQQAQSKGGSSRRRKSVEDKSCVLA